MAEENQDDELRAFLRDWARALKEKDRAAAEALRDEDYVARISGSGELDRTQELALIAQPDFRLGEVDAAALRIEASGDEALIVGSLFIRDVSLGPPVDTFYHLKIAVRKCNGRWRATASDVEEVEGAAAFTLQDAPPPRPTFRQRVSNAFRRRVLAWLGMSRERGPSFQALAYLPHRPGADYIEPSPKDARGKDEAFPVPPRELWLGYHYTAHGKLHVDRMLDIVATGGFELRPGDRILDLGCGAGRMIRHLAPLSAQCEIWGADISADHILWCRRNLSPPFNFVTTTKVPHLPFEDRSFRLIYCGSLFTHIDDLAGAWLLELHRLLSPGGRAYVTLHDNATIAQFERPLYANATIVRTITSAATYQQAKSGFGMFTIGRDDLSQVFYDRGYFARMIAPMFDLVSVTPEAYYYQTAYLLQRRA